MLIMHSANNDKWLIDVAKLNHSEFTFFLEEKTCPLLEFLLTQTMAQPVCIKNIVYLISLSQDFLQLPSLYHRFINLFMHTL